MRSTSRILAAGVIMVLVACQAAQSVGNPANAAAAPLGLTAALVALGDSIFHARACQRCHGPDGKGTKNGPDLTDSTWLQIDGTYSAIVRVVTEGVPIEHIKDSTHTLEMQPRGGRRNPLTDEQIRAVAAYVYTISDGRRHNGRP